MPGGNKKVMSIILWLSLLSLLSIYFNFAKKNIKWKSIITNYAKKKPMFIEKI